MTEDAFDALTQLLRLRPGPTRDAARLVLVRGYKMPAAAKECGLSYPSTYKTVRRCKDGMELVQRVSAGT